jgi:hypothetical protein
MPFGQSLAGDCPNVVLRAPKGDVEKCVEKNGRKCKKVEKY